MRSRYTRLLFAGLVAACGVRAVPDGAVASDTRASTLRVLGVHASALRDGLTIARDASAPVELADTTSGVAVRFSLEGACSVAGAMRDGATFFEGALDGGDTALVPTPEGVEDFAFFDARPSREELTYVVDVSRVAGLRHVNGSLELLDAGGAPRLRIARPWVAGADGLRRDATLSLEGCAADESTAPPWGRAVVSPGATTCKVHVSWRGAPYPVVVDPSWQTTATMQSTRYGHGMAKLPSGKLFVIAGNTQNICSLCGNGANTSAEVFDPSTSTWAGAGTIPSGRFDLAVSTMNDNKVFIVGGGGSPRPEMYDPGTGNITRSMASATTASWLTATTLKSGLVLIAGGDTGAPVNAASLFDEGADTVTPTTGTLVTARSHHTATLLASGKVLLIGGTGPAGSLMSAELYDPAMGTFTATGSMSHARSGHVMVTLSDGRLLVAGGGDASAEIYDPATGMFSDAGTMMGDRVTAQGVLLESGHVLVAGGTAGPVGAQLGTVEVWDPATKTFASVAPLAQPRSDFTAAALANGTAVVTGGRIGGASLGTTEVLVPSAAGVACDAKDDCGSGICRGGFCCAVTTCTGPCFTCAKTTGTCTPIVSADDPVACTGTLTCDAAGACKKKVAQTCTAAADCASGFCVDGVCCDKKCDGQCEACDDTAKPGTCTPILGESHGARPHCSAFGSTCGGACNGVTASACAFPSVVTSCGADCVDSTLTENQCDGKGGCAPEAPHACAGNFKCADAAHCKTTCAIDADCIQDYHCDTGKCVPTAVCDGSIVHAAGKTTDCAPYNCDQTGSCRTSCSVVTDCAAPNICSLSGECVAPSLLPDASGCAVTGAGGGKNATGAWFSALVGLAAIMRRRHRTRGGRSR
jgi:MYXO-CTERM domain-containing protein